MCIKKKKNTIFAHLSSKMSRLSSVHSTLEGNPREKQRSAWLLLNQRRRVVIVVKIDGAFCGNRQRRRRESHRVITVRKLVLEMTRLSSVVEIQRVTPRIVPDINLIRPTTTVVATAAVTTAETADEGLPLGTSHDFRPLPHLIPPGHPPPIFGLQFINGSDSLPPNRSVVTRRLR